jgi:hypothetical protein
MVFDSNRVNAALRFYHDAEDCQKIESKTINPPLRTKDGFISRAHAIIIGARRAVSRTTCALRSKCHQIAP